MEVSFTFDPHYCYSVKELAFIWNVSPETIRRLFIREPGVLILKIQMSAGRRTYRNIRIPGTVALRVQNRMTVLAPNTPYQKKA